MEPTSDELDALPLRSYELIERLDAAFPAACIRPGETLEAAHRYAGRRDLIDELVTLMAEDRATETADDDRPDMPKILGPREART